MDKREIAKKLNEVANVIETRGWDNGHRWGEGECVMTAMSVAKAPYEVEDAFRSYIGTSIISHWNDEQPDAKTVIAALRGAAQAQLEGSNGQTN